jgi:hypothetical protein
MLQIEQEARAFVSSREMAGERFARVKARALREARASGAFRHIVMTRNGPRVVIAAPPCGDYWTATPSGVFAYVKGPRV